MTSGGCRVMQRFQKKGRGKDEKMIWNGLTADQKKFL